MSVLNCADVLICIVSLGEELSIFASANSTTSDDIYIENFEWISSLDGIISNDLNLTTSELSLGNHTLTFRAKNSIGFWSANVSVNVLVNAVPAGIVLTALSVFKFTFRKVLLGSDLQLKKHNATKYNSSQQLE